MPELAELEAYRVAASKVIGRDIDKVHILDPHCLQADVHAAALEEALVGSRLVAVGRLGKHLLFETGSHELVFHLGMTGHLLIDGQDPADLDRSAPDRSPDWDRFVVRFADGGHLRVRDRRRFARVALDPDLRRIGPDILEVSDLQLQAALAGTHVPIKARLLDQTKLAGVGNLTADEALWRAGINPARPGGSLGSKEVNRLGEALRVTIRSSIQRGRTGGGAFEPQRHAGGRCPLDGQALAHGRIRGRSTWFCPSHQT